MKLTMPTTTNATPVSGTSHCLFSFMDSRYGRSRALASGTHPDLLRVKVRGAPPDAVEACVADHPAHGKTTDRRARGGPAALGPCNSGGRQRGRVLGLDGAGPGAGTRHRAHGRGRTRIASAGRMSQGSNSTETITLLFTDLVGSTELMAGLEADVA